METTRTMEDPTSDGLSMLADFDLALGPIVALDPSSYAAPSSSWFSPPKRFQVSRSLRDLVSFLAMEQVTVLYGVFSTKNMHIAGID
jgi:hypothetical protein